MKGARAQRGYSLIEVIVAFALLALGLTLLLGTLSGATRQVRMAADGGRAALHAQSLLDGLDMDGPLQPTRRGGEFEDGAYRWQLAIEPWDEPRPPGAPQPVSESRQLYEVALTVEWGEGGAGERLQLRSLRLVQADRSVVP